MSLWDVQENTKYGDFFSSHAIYKSNDFKDDERVSACEVYGSKCKTDDEFQELVRPFMND